MSTSEQINELVGALAKAQSEMENAPLDAQNPHFRSKYATLAAIRNATMPTLTKNGLVVFQTIDTADGGLCLVTRLAHTSGQWARSVYPLPTTSKPHEMGSALTYARRYSWAAITGIAAEEDDDGNAGQDAAKNGTKTLPALPARKSSAQAKRDQDWPRFEQALRDCQSAREVDLLHAEYQQGVYPAWNSDWRDTAEQEFAKRQAEFSQGEDLKQTLQDSLEEAEPTVGQHTTYRDSVNWLQGARSSEELTRRAKNAGYVTGIAQLTEGQRQKLRRVWADKAAELKGAINLMSRALIVLWTDEDRAKAVKWIVMVPRGTRVEFKATRRSVPQNDRMYAMLGEVAAQVKWHGVTLKVDDWKQIFLDALKRELRIVPNLDATGFVNLGRSSSDLSKEEMGDLLALIEAWGAKHNVQFNDPKEAAA